MKKTIFFCLLLCAWLPMSAGITTYTFTSANWASKQGSTVMNNTTDGWTCNQAGAGYETSTNPNFQNGVKVTSKSPYTGAGATSVKSFTNVRRITLNYATTTKGKGSFRIRVGNNAPIDTAVSITTANKDLTIVLPAAQTGQITFQVNCTTNSIYLYQISIRSEDGISPVFTQSTFQLVTDLNQLADSDQVIFGVADNQTNMIMGYYDEYVSQNNIHAIAGQYTSGRTIVAANDNAIYTLRIAQNPTTHQTAYIFQDELRYEQAYLVANGGRTKNKLTLWTDVTSSGYGNYGYWQMTIAADGAAVIENCGTSERKYLQYNASDKLFGCYADQNSQTKVCLYREVPAPASDEPAIAAPMVNFGDIVLTGTTATGSRTIEVNAMNLTADITATLKHGDVFTLSPLTNHLSPILDRDGDYLMISYSVSTPGRYIDTLVLTSGTTVVEATVMLNAIGEMTIAEAVQAGEFELVYLNPVVVTKKYDNYIFIRDETGSMLIFNTINPATDKPYGQGLETGHRLTGVTGRFVNYYGVPEIRPTAAWTVATQQETVLPEQVTWVVDSADVCRYMAIPNATVEGGSLTYSLSPTTYHLIDAFNFGLPEGTFPQVDAMVMIVHDELQLWFIRAHTIPTPLEETDAEDASSSHGYYTILGQPVRSDYRGILLSPGQKRMGY